MDLLLFAWQWVVTNFWLLISILAGAVLASFTLYSGQISSNLIGRFLIRGQDLYRAGEFVTLDGAQGRVVRIGWLYTYLEVPVQRQLHTIENSAAVAGEVVNHSRIGGSPVFVDVPIYEYGPLDRIALRDLMVDTLNAWTEAYDDQADAWLNGHDGEAEIWRGLAYVGDEDIGHAEMLAGGAKALVCNALEAAGLVVRDDDRVDNFVQVTYAKNLED